MLQKTLVNIQPNAIKKERGKKKIISFRNNVISTQISQICNGMHQCQNSNTKKKKEKKKCTEVKVRPVKLTNQDLSL